MTRTEAAEQIRRMRQFRDQACSSKENAIKALQGAGILDDKGQVSEHYPAMRKASLKAAD